MSLASYTRSYQTSPILLVGGVAGTGQLPITSILSSQNFPGGVTKPASLLSTIQQIGSVVNQVQHLTTTAKAQVTSLLGQFSGGLNPLQIPSLINQLEAFGLSDTNQVSGLINQLKGLSGNTPTALHYFGQFKVLPGHNLMDVEVATYPFANLTTAANAVFTNPLKLSIEMIAPATKDFNTTNKQSLMTALKGTLDKHTSLGGWYNVATPSYVYQGCLLTSLKDASEEDEGMQVQVRWIWDFMQPLLTAAQTQSAQNPGMATISNQTQNAGDPPGSKPLTTSLSQPAANIVQNIVAAAQNLTGAIPPNALQVGTSIIKAISPILPKGL